MIAEIRHLGGFSYLGSPYTKYHLGLDAAHCDICEVAGELLKRNVIAYSPIVHAHPISYFADIDPLDHKLWLAANEPMINAASCLIVAMLEGWKESVGLAHEVVEFKKAGKPIFYLDCKTMSIGDVP